MNDGGSEASDHVACNICNAYPLLFTVFLKEGGVCIPRPYDSLRLSKFEF